jgi:hypothetical protein
MSDIPVCQQCGKKLYKQYGSRGILATPDKKWVYLRFDTEEERDAHEIPENAWDIERGFNRYWNKYDLEYNIPQQFRDGLFHSRGCFEQWHLNHRNEIERLIRDMGEWKNPN